MATLKEETKETCAVEDDNNQNISGSGDGDGVDVQSKNAESNDTGAEPGTNKGDTKNDDYDKEKKGEGGPLNAQGTSDKTSPSAGTSHAAAAGEPKVIKKVSKQ